MTENPPDFCLVGAPKSATTALTQYLREHPQIYIPPGKEFHFFGSDLEFQGAWPFVNDRRTYLELFEAAEPNQITGESSVWYLYSKKAAEEIKAFNPEAKIVISLRNPVDMMYSRYHQELYSGNENIKDFEKALSLEQARMRGRHIPPGTDMPDVLFYREMAHYHDQVQRYKELFGKENMHILIFEEFIRDPRTYFCDLLEFLDVDTMEKIDFNPVNTHKKERFAGLNQRLRNPTKFPGNLLRWLLSRLSPRTRQNLLDIYKRLNSVPTEKSPMAESLRKNLMDEFMDEIYQLENLLNRDFSIWYRDKEEGIRTG